MNNITDILKSRAAIYEFLFTVFYKVLTKEQLQYISTFASIMADIDENGEIEQLLKEINDITNDSDLEITLNTAFTSLFTIGTNVKIAEHYYLTDTAKTDIVLSLSGLFADNDVAKPLEVNHSIDSLPVELYFMFKTCEKAANSDATTAKKIMQDQLTMLDNHLLKWAGMFADSTNNSANKNGEMFYANMSLICLNFLLYDKNLIDELINEIS